MNGRETEIKKEGMGNTERKRERERETEKEREREKETEIFKQGTIYRKRVRK